MEWTTKMIRLNRYYLIPALTPIVIIFLVSISNLNQPIRLKILFWTSPTLQLGQWFAIGGLTGALFSTSLSLNYINHNTKFSQFRDNRNDDPSSTHNNNKKKDLDNVQTDFKIAPPDQYPERDVRDPSPTVSVPYRVLRNNNELDINEEPASVYDLDNSGESESFNDDQQYYDNEQMSDNSNDWVNYPDENW